MYLDRLVGEDIHFYMHVDHCEMCTFDDIVFYPGWLTCGSRLTSHHLPERIMR